MPRKTLLTTWYRCIDACGKLWCESKSLEEVVERSPGAKQPVTYTRAQVFELFEDWEEFTPEPPAKPIVGQRAWLRYDDGVAVVREVSEDGESVVVSFLPVPWDTDGWESGEWKKVSTDWMPARDFSYDDFPDGGVL